MDLYCKIKNGDNVSEASIKSEDVLIKATDAASIIEESHKTGYKNGYKDGAHDVAVVISTALLAAGIITSLISDCKTDIKNLFKKKNKFKKEKVYEADFQENQENK